MNELMKISKPVKNILKRVEQAGYFGVLFQGIDVIALLCVFRVMFKNTCNRDVYNSCMYNVKGREQFLIGYMIMYFSFGILM